MKKNVLIVLGIIFFVVVIQWLLSSTEFFQNLELRAYDIRSQLSTDKGLFGKDFHHADKDIVIVAIDNYTKQQLLKNPPKEFGNWPWPRDVWNGVVDFIEEGHPKALMFDMVFEGLNENTWNDRRFVQNLRRYDNIILGTYLDNPKVQDNAFTKSIEIDSNDFIPTSQPLDVTIDNKKLDDAITYFTNAPVNDIYSQYISLGVVNKILDSDSVVRKTQPIFKLVKDGKTYYMPSLAFAGFLKYMGEGDKITIKDNKILYKDRVIPIDNNGIVNISWHKLNHSYSYIPLSKIILNKGTKDEIKPEFFKDKLVIIGKTASGARVDLSSIIDPSYTSPEANAVALDNFINDSNPKDKKARKFISVIPKPVQYGITFLACIIVAFLGLVPKNPYIGFVNGFLSILLYLFLSFWLFANPESRILLPIVVPLYYLAVTSGIVFAFRFHQEMKRKNSITSVFGKFVSPKVLSTLLKNPQSLVLKNTKKHLTVLFCDVKNFTALSEKCNPEQLVTDLNELFNEVVNVIFENNGTVDKFIGDCIMAYWGDLVTSENDAYMAVKTALEIKKKISELQVKNAKENKIILDVKIGINTGEALLGLAGAEKIMSYTAMGDAVNIASRLESNCTNLRRDILISDSTYQEAKDKIIVVDVGKISVKGRDKQIEVYEPIGLVDDGTVETGNS